MLLLFPGHGTYYRPQALHNKLPVSGPLRQVGVFVAPQLEHFFFVSLALRQFLGIFSTIGAVGSEEEEAADMNESSEDGVKKTLSASSGLWIGIVSILNSAAS